MDGTKAVEWHLISTVSEITPSEPKQVAINDLELSVHNVGGAFFAIGDICTHAFARLSFGLINDSVITCPLHQAKFDIRTGKVLEGPADEDLDSYLVKVEDGKLYVGVPIF